ncbi:MAG: hypothetical protein KDB53_06195, partial [Planctomycetes bacterium]|nr:hypothetical protein [Planctomycetota bacterium]
FNPAKARVWRRSNQKIYGTYERLFDLQTHGWSNVQASHVNLPLGHSHEAGAMINAAALLTPYLPALAASSPLVEGEFGPAVDNRLHWIVSHQARVPESTGTMVPEYIEDLADYKRKILRPMYAAISRLANATAIRREFLNARAAVVKFSRNALEVRVLDVQECVKMDIAIAAYVRAALQGLSIRIRNGKLALPPHDELVADFHAVIMSGGSASVQAPHLGPVRDPGQPIDAREALGYLLEIARDQVRKSDAHYMDEIEALIERGSLSERIRQTLLPYVDDEREFIEASRRLYIRLADCLIENTPWDGALD